MKPLSRVLASALLLGALAASPAMAQRKTDRNYQWYWGGQGGAFMYKTNFQPYYFDPVLGGHWLITARRTALYVSYEQAWFLTDARATIADPNSTSGLRDVSFRNMRRLMFGVLAFPTQKRIEPFAGGGFALMQVLDPLVDCSGTGPNSDCPTLSDQISAQDRAQDGSSKAFFWMMGGIQINNGRLALFGHYLITSAARGFLIEGTTHSIQGGIRYAIGTAKEGVSEGH
jgi:hypothetical protein